MAETKEHPLSFALVPLIDMWTRGRWGPKGSTLPPAAHAKAAQLGQKLSIGLEAAYQVSARFIPDAARTSVLLSCECNSK